MEGVKFLKNVSRADLAICEKADSFLQSAMWGRFKSRFGWAAAAFVVEWAEGGEKPLLVLSRRIAPGVGMAYIPWGPELPKDRGTGNREQGLGFGSEVPDGSHTMLCSSDYNPSPFLLTELAEALRPLLPKTTVFIRFDLPWFSAGDQPPVPSPQSLLKRAAADIQPPDTVLVDLSLREEDILAAMKPKWRYNIGLAEKHGVTVSESGEQGLNVFYRLLAETAVRDGISVHSIDYYRALFEECAAPAQLHLYTAEHENDALAAIVVLFRAKQAVYLYGASANVKRNLMAPYALQWRAMRDAKASGCTQYDLFGIPPSDDPAHPMAGLYRFKTGFGGRIVHRPGSWDCPYKPVVYALFRTAERLRKKVRDGRKTRGRK